jgi:hypothetical protein
MLEVSTTASTTEATRPPQGALPAICQKLRYT